MLIACLFVPRFPLAARLRVEPELAGKTVVIVEGASLVAVSRRAGLTPGMTLTQARALAPELVSRKRDPEVERAAQEALLDVADSFSPRVEDSAPGLVYLDGVLPDQAHAIAFMAHKKAGLPARVGLGSSKLVARLARSTIVPPGQERAFLAPLPLRLLNPPPSLARWGLRTIGDLAQLPPDRLDPRLRDAASGLDSSPFICHHPPATFTEGLELDWALTTLDQLLELLTPALQRLVTRLEIQALGCLRLDLDLHPDHRSLLLPAPTRDVKTLLTLLRLDLERRPPGAPVDRFLLSAHPDRPRNRQLTLFGPIEVSPDNLATALARLAILGDGRAGAPEAIDGYAPERLSITPYAPPRLTPALPVPQGLSIRTLRPPRAVPLHQVRSVSGPWCLEEAWHLAERLYWDVELGDGKLYRAFPAHSSDDWFIDGAYD